ncbi:hypothetical protein K1719_002566 [Acacia pycnantha]|nr:hypothetical protein K1719_002566 [Acacia pycnantha]
MFNIVYWNTRGCCDPSLFRNLKTLFLGPKPNILILADTRISDESRLHHLRRLGFDCLRMIPSIGRSGGIAVLWDSDAVSISVLEEDRQFMHMSCDVRGLSNFILTGVYAIPHSDLRSFLWEKVLVFLMVFLFHGLFVGI